MQDLGWVVQKSTHLRETPLRDEGDRNPYSKEPSYPPTKLILTSFAPHLSFASVLAGFGALCPQSPQLTVASWGLKACFSPA